jgi:hypothetical protein
MDIYALNWCSRFFRHFVWRHFSHHLGVAMAENLDETTPLTAQESFNAGKSKSFRHGIDKHFATEHSPAHVEAFFNTVRHHFYHFRNEQRQNEHRLNIILSILLLLTTALLLLGGGYLFYRQVMTPFQARRSYEAKVRIHAQEAAKLVEKCRGINWKTACDKLGAAGVRRNLKKTDIGTDEYEDFLLNSDDPTTTYDQYCLRVHRLKLYGDITFPYHSSQLLQSGGNQTMALFIQVG